MPGTFPWMFNLHDNPVWSHTILGVESLLCPCNSEIMGKLSDFFMPQFHHLCNGDNKVAVMIVIIVMKDPWLCPLS